VMVRVYVVGPAPRPENQMARDRTEMAIARLGTQRNRCCKGTLNRNYNNSNESIPTMERWRNTTLLITRAVSLPDQSLSDWKYA